MPATATAPYPTATSIAPARLSRWARAIKPFNPGPFAPQELAVHKETVHRFLSLDPSYISSPLLRHLNLQLPSANRIISPPPTLSLAAAIGTLNASDLTKEHRKLVYDLDYALWRIRNFDTRRNGTLALPTSEKMGPRSQYLLWCAVLGLVGIYVGVPSLYQVTIELRPGEDYDTVRTSLRERFEERSLLPFLHAAVFVPSDGFVRPHLHMLVLARHFDWVHYHREWRALGAFAFERNKRSGLATSVHITEVVDLTGLIRLKPRYDVATGRAVGRAGYHSGNGNLTRPGAKAIASQTIKTLSNELLHGGFGEFSDLHWHLRSITYSSRRRFWSSRTAMGAGP
jgi:hypothetical protein